MDLVPLQKAKKKLTFIERLEENNGDEKQAAFSAGTTLRTVAVWEKSDENFRSALFKTRMEIRESLRSGEPLTSEIIGTRPYELHLAINARRKRGGESTFPMASCDKMCKFLCNYSTNINYKEAAANAGIAPATVGNWKRAHPEFAELYDEVTRGPLQNVFDKVLRKALEDSPSGDEMAKFLIRQVGHKIGAGYQPASRPDSQPSVEINIQQNSPQQSDAIIRAHEKAMEASMNIIDITARK